MPITAQLSFPPDALWWLLGGGLLLAVLMGFGQWGCWLAARVLYRFRVLGREHVPARGGALLVCNHVSYLDWLLLLAAQPRPIRFVILRSFTETWGLGRLLRLSGVIPVDAGDGPRSLVKALHAAAAALQRGELVCVFAEGALTRTGAMLPFQRGIEKILKHAPVPVVPAYLDGMFGSLFSYQGGRLFWKWPRWRLPVTVGFGPPLPPTVSVAEVRAAVQRVSADCAADRVRHCRPVHRQFVRQAAAHPFRPCFLDPAGKIPVLTYGKALAGALCLARRLRPVLGDSPMVALWLPSSVGGALANIALALLGKTAVNLNYTSSAASLRSAMRQCAIRHVLTSRRFTARVELEVEPGVETIYLEDIAAAIGSAERLVAFLTILLLPGWVLENWVLDLGRHGPDDLATVIFSSGSTGDPKGVMLTHGNIAANAASMIQAAAFSPRDRVLGVLPFFHSFGFTVTLWAPLQIGGAVAYYPDPRQAKEIGELCHSQRCTVFLTTPTFLRFCLRRCEADDFRSLRLLICGAEKLPQSLAHEFLARFSVLPLEGYGCTELSPVVSTNLPDVSVAGLTQVANRPGTIGQPIPGVAVRVVDPDTLRPLPVGTEGLLQVYGPNVMKGYLHRPDLTQAAIVDGWYKTGDMARLDDAGFLTITGRLARFAKVAGEMVPLEKIEEELHAILQTCERVCAVTAVPDDKKGERLVVLHLPLNGHEPRHLSQQLGSRGLPNLWLPSERDFVQIVELPILGSGKLDLQRVKDLAVYHLFGNGHT